MICEGKRSGYYLTRTAKIDSTHAHDFGWVVNVSYSGFFVTLSPVRILNWLKSKHLICEACYGQRSIINPAMVGYTSGNLFRILDSHYVLMLGLRRFYDAVCILSWIGDCWVLTLKVSTTMILVSHLKWDLHFICPYCLGCPCCTSMMFVCVDVFLLWMGIDCI